MAELLNGLMNVEMNRMAQWLNGSINVEMRECADVKIGETDFKNVDCQ